jgi:hypothetical protein
VPRSKVGRCTFEPGIVGLTVTFGIVNFWLLGLAREHGTQ